MSVFPFRVSEMSGLCQRILRIQASRDEPVADEPPGRVSISSKAKRSRILEDARLAVLDRIRRPG